MRIQSKHSSAKLLTTPSLTKRAWVVQTDRLFVDHTELNLPERLFYPAISDPSTKIGRNKMHNFVKKSSLSNDTFYDLVESNQEKLEESGEKKEELLYDYYQ